MAFNTLRRNIVEMEVDAIVNPTNRYLILGSGASGAILQAAGEEEMRNACTSLAPVEVGDAVITPGFQLPAKFVIHAVGPVYYEDDPQGSMDLLSRTYRNILNLAKAKRIKSIAVPLISSGFRGFPKDDAIQIATDAIQEFLSDNEMDIFLVLYDKESYRLGSSLIGEIDSYIEANYDPPVAPLLSDEEWSASLQRAMAMPKVLGDAVTVQQTPNTLDSYLNNHVDVNESFSIKLSRMIDGKGKTDVEVYNRACIDRKLFSKIRRPKYHPKKNTVLALSVALELSIDETSDLLRHAGYSLTHASKSDVIVEYFIVNKKYDVYSINEALSSYDLPPLVKVA